MSGGLAGPGGLPAALAAVADDAAAVGLRVHPMCIELPPNLDPDVVAATALSGPDCPHRNDGCCSTTPPA